MDQLQDLDSLERFLDALRSGELGAQEAAVLEQCLLADPELRRRYRERMRLEANLLSTFQTVRPEIVPPLMVAPRPSGLRHRWIPMIGTGIAAVLALGFLISLGRKARSQPPVIARVESSSEAGWSDTSSAGAGAELRAGEIELRNGLAELRFTSGVLLTLEAPARLELIDPMRCRLHRGIAVVQVPDRAKGFTLETPNGHAVDHGTRFSVNVDEHHHPVADFEVLDGLISVHHPKTGSIIDLTESKAARMTSAGIQRLATQPSQALEARAVPALKRLRTHGRETSIVPIRGKMELERLLDPDLLMVKKDITRVTSTHSKPAHYARDRRSLVAFKLAGMHPNNVSAARLRLNLVPTRLGFASSLPEYCTFQLYGIRDDATLEAWSSENLRWEDAPGSVGIGSDIDETEVRLLASVEIPRGRLSGPVLFESADLTTFIREDRTGNVGFLLVRATPPLDSASLVHAFAASTHPDAAGPTLELEMTKP